MSLNIPGSVGIFAMGYYYEFIATIFGLAAIVFAIVFVMLKILIGKK